MVLLQIEDFLSILQQRIHIAVVFWQAKLVVF